MKIFSESYTYTPNIEISCNTQPESGYPLLNCIDYDPDTYASFDANDIIISFDFLKSKLIDTVWMNVGNVDSFIVEHSADNSTWTAIADGTAGSQSTAIWLEGFTAISRRYWRITIDRDNDAAVMNIFELLMMQKLLEIDEDAGASKVNVEYIDRAGKILNKANGSLVKTQNTPFRDMKLSFEYLSEDIESAIYRIFSEKTRRALTLWINPDSIDLYRVLWNSNEYPFIRAYSYKISGFAGELTLQEY